MNFLLCFHIDENVDSTVAAGLQQRKIDVTTTVSAGLLSATDDEQLAFALREGRVFVTHDRHFLGLAARGVPHAGICYCHLQARSIGELIRSLALLATLVEADLMRNRVEFL